MTSKTKVEGDGQLTLWYCFSLNQFDDEHHTYHFYSTTSIWLFQEEADSTRPKPSGIQSSHLWFFRSKWSWKKHDDSEHFRAAATQFWQYPAFWKRFETASPRITQSYRIADRIAFFVFTFEWSYQSENCLQILELTETRIGEVLDIVNLQQAAPKKTKQYSTGMKQRLGLAIALLPNPDLLILDEPTNGLDPNGIIEIRTILQELQQRGKTIFLSSHLLTEVEKIVSQVGILKDGALVFQGTMEELEQVRSSNVLVKIISSDAKKAAQILAETHQVTIQNAQEFSLNLPYLDRLPIIIRNLVKADIDLYEVSPQKNNLEHLFISLTA